MEYYSISVFYSEITYKPVTMYRDGLPVFSNSKSVVKASVRAEKTST